MTELLDEVPMEEKAVVSVIITAGWKVNRTYLARLFADFISNELGLETDISHLGLVDSEPPCDVEKGPFCSAGDRFILSEHSLNVPFRLDPQDPVPEAVVRPGLPPALWGNEILVSVIGAPNAGKGTLISAFWQMLDARADLRDNVIEYRMLDHGETMPLSVDRLKLQVERIRPRVKVVLYTRRAVLGTALSEVLKSTDNQPES
jgi:hypothetical protein